MAGSARPRNGGVAARRAVARWGWRLFRRDWRQQLLVLALLTVAIAAVIFGTSAAYNVIPSRAATFGNANLRVVFAAPDPARLPGEIAEVRRQYGDVDVIERAIATVPGSVERVELRVQDPNGRLGGGMLRLRSGRYPARAGETAVTDRVAELLHARLGSVVELGGATRRVVGLVENPADLHDEFALVPRLPASGLDSVTVLAQGPSGNAAEQCIICRGFAGGHVEYRGTTERTTGATLVLGLSTVALLLVALIATAGFVVVAQRRSRQLGMLAAIGATGRHLELVMLTNGALIGGAAAVLGAATGLVAWLSIGTRFETAAAHRIDRFDVPWALVGGAMLLAVATALTAAWWPARTAARNSVVDALAARPPAAKPAHRSALGALVFAAAGFLCLMFGIDTKRDGAANVPLLLGGLIAIVVAVVLVGPFAIRLLAAAGSRLPVAARLALRDLARYRARSSSALAAIAVGLGIAVAVVAITAGAQNGAEAGNLSNRQLRIEVGSPEYVPLAVDTAGQQAAVDRLTATLGGATVLPLDVATAPVPQRLDDGRLVRLVAELVRPVGGNTYRGLGPLYVATPGLLRRFGIDPALVTPDVDVLTPERGALFLNGGKVFIGNVPDPRSRRPARLRVVHIDGSRYGSVPRSFVTPAALERYGLPHVRSGWLVETNRSLTSAQLTAARDAAAQAGLAVEVRDAQGGLRTTRTVATLAGILLALAILAMTVGLIRSEAGRDLRTLTATGATSTARRTITAVTAGALGLLGVLLGAAAAYLALVASYLDDLHPLARVPIGYLAAMAVGVPLLAAVAGFVLGGHEPRVITRAVLD